MGKSILDLYKPETVADSSKEISSELPPTVSDMPKPCEPGLKKTN